MNDNDLRNAINQHMLDCANGDKINELLIVTQTIQASLEQPLKDMAILRTETNKAILWNSVASIFSIAVLLLTVITASLVIFVDMSGTKERITKIETIIGK